MGMPEPLDVWLGKDEVEGVPSQGGTTTTAMNGCARPAETSACIIDAIGSWVK